MSTPLSTPVKQAKLRLVSGRSQPLVAEFKRLLGEQHERLWTKHQQDLELIEDVRSYAKARLSIERQYTAGLAKLARQHSAHIAKKFQLLAGSEQQSADNKTPVRQQQQQQQQQAAAAGAAGGQKAAAAAADSCQLLNDSEASDSRLQKRLAREPGLEEPEEASSLYAVWAEHSQRLAAVAKHRSEQFEQLGMLVDKLKEVRARKAAIGKKCLDTHLRRVHEDILASVLELERAKKLYYEDESQAKKAREHEEKIKRKRSGLMSKFTGQDLQAKKERTSARREANDIQSTQARNDYIMALAAANAHLDHYFERDLTDFMLLIDDGLLDHCKISMATLSECDISSLKEHLSSAKYWSKMINLTGSQLTNSFFLDSHQSVCLRDSVKLPFEPCNEDPIRCISLEHNADYALQHEIDKWLTWFKKECRNLGQLLHQLELCQRAFSDGKKSVELAGQTVDDLEGRMVELKQLIRKSEAAKQKAQARLAVIRDGGMQIEEWAVIEAEIQASAAAKAQQELDEQRRRRSQELRQLAAHQSTGAHQSTSGYLLDATLAGHQHQQVKLQLSQDSDAYDSVHNLASISRSPSSATQQPPHQQPPQQQDPPNKHQSQLASYAALADPAAAWQDDYSSAWGHQPAQAAAAAAANYNLVVTPETGNNNHLSAISTAAASGRNLLNADGAPHQAGQAAASMTVQSSSPLSAVVDAIPPSTSPYPILAGEAYKSDFECDYNTNHQHIRSTMSSAETSAGVLDHYKRPVGAFGRADSRAHHPDDDDGPHNRESAGQPLDELNSSTLDTAYELLNRQVLTLYDFDKTNEDDLSFRENELLLILEVNDENWFRARNLETGHEGYIPAPYVRLWQGADTGHQQQSAPNEGAPMDGTNNPDGRHREPAMVEPTTATDQSSFDRSGGAWNTQDIQNADQNLYCQALYDYQPEKSFDDDDGLPHLVLKQAELMRVVEQGDDGWWLVEREATGQRGHVPSMLVELIGEDDDQDQDQDEQADASIVYSDEELDESARALPPTFEPPALEAPQLDETYQPTSDHEQQEQATQQETKLNNTTNNLTATSFIIIEPTPEVEWKKVDGEEEEEEEAASPFPRRANVTSDGGSSGGREPDQRVTVVGKGVPAGSTSYSIVNEDFVLEKPTRRPSHHHAEHMPHHETPTIPEEENEAETATREEVATLEAEPAAQKPTPNEAYNEADITPCVIIETCEDKAREDDGDDTFSLEDDSQPSGFSSPKDSSGSHNHRFGANVDVSPILRYRAEQFSKQIIEEALELVQEASFERQVQPPAHIISSPATTQQNYYI